MKNRCGTEYCEEDLEEIKSALKGERFDVLPSSNLDNCLIVYGEGGTYDIEVKTLSTKVSVFIVGARHPHPLYNTDLKFQVASVPPMQAMEVIDQFAQDLPKTAGQTARMLQ